MTTTSDGRVTQVRFCMAEGSHTKAEEFRVSAAAMSRNLAVLGSQVS
jgi:hypothetical protein